MKYDGILDLGNSLKVETDFLQNTVLPSVDLKYSNPWGVETLVRVMDIKEMCAEKIRATSGRARYRDFYDLYMILQKYNLDMGEIAELVKRKEIRETISKESITNNWEIAKQDKSNEVTKIYFSIQIQGFEIEKMIDNFNFLPITK